MAKSRNRALSLILAFAMMVTLVLGSGITVFAEESGESGHSHPCGAECAYVEGVDCTLEHEHNEDCGIVQAAECDHPADCADCAALLEETNEDEGDPAPLTGSITGFADVDGINVDSDTALDDVQAQMPTAVVATVLPEGEDAASATISIPVSSWNCTNEGGYQADIDAFYTFEPVLGLPEGVTMDVGVELPYILVTVGDAQSNVVTLAANFRLSDTSITRLNETSIILNGTIVTPGPYSYCSSANTTEPYTSLAFAASTGGSAGNSYTSGTMPIQSTDTYLHLMNAGNTDNANVLSVPIPPVPASDTLYFANNGSWGLFVGSASGSAYTGGGWSANGDTLTLNGFDYTTTAAIGLVMADGSTLELQSGSTNSITVECSTANADATALNVATNAGALTIEGSGTLNLSTGVSGAITLARAVGIGRSDIYPTLSISGTPTINIDVTPDVTTARIGLQAQSVDISGSPDIDISMTSGTTAQVSGISCASTFDMAGGTMNIEVPTATDMSIGLLCVGAASITGGSITSQSGTAGNNYGALFFVAGQPTLTGMKVEGNATGPGTLEELDFVSPNYVLSSNNSTIATYAEITEATPPAAETLYFGNGESGWSLYTDEALETVYTGNAGNWSASANKLELDDFTYITSAAVALRTFADTTIDVTGNCSITSVYATGAATSTYGIYAYNNANKNLTFTGTGSLTVKSGSASMRSHGIRAASTTVDGVTLTAKSGASDESYGLDATGNNFTMKNGATVHLEAGAGVTESRGLMAQYIYSSGASSTLTAKATATSSGIPDTHTSIRVSNQPENLTSTGSTDGSSSPLVSVAWTSLGCVYKVGGSSGTPVLFVKLVSDPTYSATLTVSKDGNAYASHGKTFTLRKSGSSNVTGTGAGGSVTFDGLVNGTWNLWEGSKNTGVQITVSSANATGTINYYTVEFDVADDASGDSSGSTVSATYNGTAITSGDAVFGGKQLVVTAAGGGASSYTYLWSGTGTSGETTAALTIATLGAKVDALCTVTGTILPIPLFFGQGNTSNNSGGFSNGWGLYTDDTFSTQYTDNAGNWSAAANNLTLDDFVFVTSALTALTMPSSSTITLAAGSENSIKTTGTSDSTRTVAVSFGGSLATHISTITGSGSLTLTTSQTGQGTRALNCGGKLVIDGAKLIAKSGATTNTDYASNAIWSSRGIEVKDAATVTASAGNTGGTGSIGINVANGNGITVTTDCVVKTQGYDNAIIAYNVVPDPASIPVYASTNYDGTGPVNATVSGYSYNANGATAKWVQIGGTLAVYTITFNPNGGTVSPTTATTGTDGKLTSLPSASLSGNTFNGWFTAISGGTQITTSYVFGADTTVYAQWTPAGGATAPTITTSSLPGGVKDAPYSQALAATGTAPITWSIDTGSLPAGLTINASTGVISGTPTAAGTSNFTIKATNSAGNATKALSIVVTANPAITTDLPLLVEPGTSDASTTLTVTAVNATSYQWYKDGTLLNGETNASITINKTGGDGVYYVVVSGNGKTVQSNSCTVRWSTTNAGTIIVDVAPEPGMPNVSIADVEAFRNAALTDDEKADVASNPNVTYTVTLNVTGGLEHADVGTANQKAQAEGYTVAAYYDITIEKDKLVSGASVGGSYPMPVTNLNGSVDIQLEISTEFRAENRDFAMVRVHGGTAAVLADKDSNANTITVSSDRFSLYSLVYKDTTPPGGDDNDDNGSGNSGGGSTAATGGNPQTGDAGNLPLWITLFVLSLGAVAAGVWLYRKNRLTMQTEDRE